MKLWNSIKSLFDPPTPAKHKTKSSDLSEIQQIVGFQFADLSILELSLTHRSFFKSGESNNSHAANERLEFLGDSVLGMVISDKLFEDFPHLREGELTKMKAKLVNEVTLFKIGTETGINNFIRMSKEEERSGGRNRPSIVSDAFESVIAAVYLDGGLEPARKLILELIYAHRDRLISDESQRNYKGEFLELIQAQGGGNPRYDVVSEKGPDHEKIFDVEVYVGNQKIGYGSGNSKKEAEQMAASNALENYQRRN